MQFQKRLSAKELAPRARFELATLRLTAEVVQNLSAASGVAYVRLGVILTLLAAPNPAPKLVTSRSRQTANKSREHRLTKQVIPFLHAYPLARTFG
jgi:hypothetical protein